MAVQEIKEALSEMQYPEEPIYSIALDPDYFEEYEFDFSFLDDMQETV